MIQRTPLAPFGLRMTGLPLAGIDSAFVAELRELLALHGFVVFPEQHLSDGEFVEFLGKFGALTFSQGETAVPGYPDLNIVSNVGRTTPPRSVFHVDTSYVRRPPAYTALRAVQVPAVGGETVFTNQYRAYETLPAAVKERLAGRLIRHVVTGLDDADLDERSAAHPAARRHPISGRTALYLSTPERCTAIDGLPAAESAELIDLLYAHSTAPANTYRHSWSEADVLMWDNGCVMHRADHSGVNGDRVMHRGMVGSLHASERS